MHLLNFLINRSISQGTFPDELKISKVLPIYKNEDEQLIQNNRLLSFLSFFSKIFEKVSRYYYNIYSNILTYVMTMDFDSENPMVQIMRLLHI